MRKHYVIFILLLCASVSAAQSSASDSDKRNIVALENAWNQAEWQKDRPALELLLAPELIYVEYDGTLMNRTEYLANLLAPSLHPQKIVNESINVHAYGVFAVANGIYHETGIRNGKAYTVRTRFTDTWMRRDQTWVCVSSQSTSIGEP